MGIMIHWVEGARRRRADTLGGRGPPAASSVRGVSRLRGEGGRKEAGEGGG